MEYACGNVFLRPNHCNKGQVVEEHMHEFDHTTFFVKGKFRAQRWRQALDEEGNPIYVDRDETDPNEPDVVVKQKVPVWILVSDRIFSAGQWCLIEKGVKHRFEALEDDSLLVCVYAHRDPQSGEVVQDFNGWMKAYE